MSLIHFQYSFSTQYINEANRVTLTSSSLLDLIFTKSNCNVLETGIINCDMITDHHLSSDTFYGAKAGQFCDIQKFWEF